MGEVFFKRLFGLFLLVVGLFVFMYAIKDNEFVSGDVVSASYNSNLISGYATHPLYNNFNLPENGFTFNNNSNVISVSDSAVYGVGYYSINGSAWQGFNLVGTQYSSGSSWLTGLSAYTLPSFGVGEHYIIVYSCTYYSSNASWDCHGNKWQLIVVNNNVSNGFPVISFESPTPGNGATVTTSSQRIVANVSDDSNAISSWIDFDKSLMGYWSMDSSSSSGIYDNSTYKNFGTFTGGLSTSSIVSGVRGRALGFNGMTNGLNMGDVLDLGLSDFSYSLWIKTNDNRRSYFLTKGASGGFNGVRIETGTSGYGSAIFGYATDYTENIAGPIPINDGAWHHVVVTFDRDSYATWYTDSVAGTPVDISAGNNQNVDVADNLYVASTDRPFNGSVDELMIFNRVLSSSEIKALYNSKINKFDSTFNNLVNGQHNYTVYAMDGTGNFVNSGQRNFVVNAAVTCVPSCSGKQCGTDGCTGTCGSCSNSHGSTSCSSSGLCQPSCLSGYANCDFNNVNGCETQLGTTSNCASCGNVCSSGQTCTNNICIGSTPTPTCSDGIQNQGETGMDCGGPCSACQIPTGSIFYISTGGINNGSRDGSISQPWNTLKYACDNVRAYGSTIHITAGTYIETEECVLAVGVSIEGEGTSSIIKSRYVSSRYGDITHASIALISSTENTPGNQKIHNFVLDGDGERGSIGMVVKRRGNVQIYDMTIKDFYINGISFLGAGQHDTPGVFATGNKLFNSMITNCGDAETDPNWNGGGLIETDGQEGLEIYNNVLTENSRPQGHNGNIINGHVGKGEKFYNNICTKPDYDGDTWNFHIENWNSLGGYEIYNNTFYGGDTAIDVGGEYNVKGDYPYSMYIHNNFFTGPHARTNGGEYAICLEGTSTNDVWIYRNHFLNYPEAVQVCDGFDWATQQKGIYFGYNVLEKSGWSDGVTYGNIMEFLNSYSASTISDVYIYNNVILGNDYKHTTAIKIAVSGTLSNFNVKNNIIMHNYNGGYFNIVNSGSISGLNVDHNIIYDNWNSNNPVGSNYVFPNNLNVDPSFVNENGGNFHLNSGSQAIDAGVNVSLTSDYEGKSVPYGGAPDIGAFEYR